MWTRHRQPLLLALAAVAALAVGLGIRAAGGFLVLTPDTPPVQGVLYSLIQMVATMFHVLAAALAALAVVWLIAPGPVGHPRWRRTGGRLVAVGAGIAVVSIVGYVALSWAIYATHSWDPARRQFLTPLSLAVGPVLTLLQMFGTCVAAAGFVLAKLVPTSGSTDSL